jgi:hypothetical protein
MWRPWRRREAAPARAVAPALPAWASAQTRPHSVVPMAAMVRPYVMGLNERAREGATVTISGPYSGVPLEDEQQRRRYRQALVERYELVQAAHADDPVTHQCPLCNQRGCNEWAWAARQLREAERTP